MPATVRRPSSATWTVLFEPSTRTTGHGPVSVTVLPVPCTFAPSDPQATVRRCDRPSTTGRSPARADEAMHSADAATVVARRRAESRRIVLLLSPMTGDAPGAENASA